MRRSTDGFIRQLQTRRIAGRDRRRVAHGVRPLCVLFAELQVHRADDGSEIPPDTEAAEAMLVELADAAGNRVQASGPVVVFDFRAPRPVAGTMTAELIPPAAR